MLGREGDKPTVDATLYPVFEFQLRQLIEQVEGGYVIIWGGCTS
jgi:hypothetical protein